MLSMIAGKKEEFIIKSQLLGFTYLFILGIIIDEFGSLKE